ncbi:MAG: hypothetical protein M4579_006324 [Chaenotheca gracillima]|nr:MAG: hypothetical protein M4579_006324 [Chaenotheca gracillima]
MAATMSEQQQNQLDPPTEKSPSPPGSPPVQETPGHRATALHNIFISALSHTLRTCSYENFAACFPTPARACPESLRELWRQMVGKMEVLAKSEFDSILSERAVVPSLNTLDRLIADASKRKTASGGVAPVPPHTLPPAQILRAHLTPHLSQAQSTLNARLQTEQSRNAVLMERVVAQRREIESLVGGLGRVVGDLEGAVGVLGKEGQAGVAGLGDEIVEVEGELGATSR